MIGPLPSSSDLAAMRRDLAARQRRRPPSWAYAALLPDGREGQGIGFPDSHYVLIPGEAASPPHGATVEPAGASIETHALAGAWWAWLLRGGR